MDFKKPGSGLNFLIFGFFVSIYFYSSNALLGNHTEPESYQISLLTYSPGNEIYSIFGHSSIRVKTTNPAYDYVYNYGTFDFDTDNFYFEFLKGKLAYRLSKVHFEYVLKQVIHENRTLKESVLNLTALEKQKFVDALENNYLPENRNYFYDFFYNNCATRLYTLIDTSALQNITTSTEVKPYSFRALIKPYLRIKPWAKLGVNVAMGIMADRKASTKESSFLPDKLLDILQKSERTDQRSIFVDPERILNVQTPHKKSYTIHPTLFFSALFLLYSVIFSIELVRKKRFYLADYFIFIPTGLLGVLLLTLWFGTNHYIHTLNHNILWANPLYLLLLFKKRNLRKLQFTCYLLLLVAFIHQVIIIRELSLILLIFVLFSRLIIHNKT